MTARELTADLELPASCCAGHFPGQPLVPGVLQLMLAARALAPAIGDGSVLIRVPRVRWRKPVTPDDVVRMSAQVDGRRARFKLVVGDHVVCDGSLEFGHRPELRSGSDASPAAEDPGPDPSRLLPHRPPMLFIERVLGWDDTGGVCRGRIDPDACLAAASPLVPASAAIEVAAQAMAAIEACRSGDGGKPRRGYLVAMAQTELSVSGFPVGSVLTVEVGRTTWSPPMARASARVAVADQEIVSCSLATWESER